MKHDWKCLVRRYGGSIWGELVGLILFSRGEHVTFILCLENLFRSKEMILCSFEGAEYKKRTQGIFFLLLVNTCKNKMCF